MQFKNKSVLLDELKLKIAKEVVLQFTAEEIRKKSFENLGKWEDLGFWNKKDVKDPYSVWFEILKKQTKSLLR